MLRFLLKTEVQSVFKKKCNVFISDNFLFLFGKQISFHKIKHKYKYKGTHLGQQRKIIKNLAKC